VASVRTDTNSYSWEISMAQFTKEQKTWVDKFLESSDGKGATGTSPNATGLDGLDSGKVQALGPGDLVGPAKEIGKAAWNWVNAQGETKIVIENRTSKVLKFAGKETQKLDYPKQAIFDRFPPPEIAAKDKDTITVKTDKFWRGKTTANTSGSVMYEIDDPYRKTTVKVNIAWKRKGNGAIDEGFIFTDSDLYEIKFFQNKAGEFTFWVMEKPPATKPKDPQPPVDPKPKEPETGGSKDSKSPPPADTNVLFAQGKFVLTSEAKSQLHDFARAYLAAKSTATVSVDGYASKEGQEASNKTLSFDRAEAVYNYLVNDGKLPSGNVEWHGHGVTSDFDPDPKKLEPNRRVTIKLS
jgi:outer membrane protein OmpA-like peptidoglycan-associated protein